MLFGCPDAPGSQVDLPQGGIQKRLQSNRSGLLGQLPGFKQMNMLKKMRGAQMGDFFEGMDDMGLGDLMGGAAPAARRGPTQAELRARVAAKQKLRKKSKAAAKARKKNKRK